jgi:hypothetical protein
MIEEEVMKAGSQDAAADAVAAGAAADGIVTAPGYHYDNSDGNRIRRPETRTENRTRHDHR